MLRFIMAFDPIKLRVLAEGKEEENWRFRQFVKRHCRLDSEELDALVFELTERVWAGIDCTQCANCCKEVRPTLSEEDVERLARRMGMGREKFIETYLEEHRGEQEQAWQTRSTPCPFLKENRCSVYVDRPGTCRGYPYLYEEDFVFRTIGTIERTSTCPIVYEVMEAMKAELGFRRRHKRGRI